MAYHFDETRKLFMNKFHNKRNPTGRHHLVALKIKNGEHGNKKLLVEAIDKMIPRVRCFFGRYKEYTQTGVSIDFYEYSNIVNDIYTSIRSAYNIEKLKKLNTDDKDLLRIIEGYDIVAEFYYFLNEIVRQQDENHKVKLKLNTDKDNNILTETMMEQLENKIDEYERFEMQTHSYLTEGFIKWRDTEREKIQEYKRQKDIKVRERIEAELEKARKVFETTIDCLVEEFEDEKRMNSIECLIQESTLLARKFYCPDCDYQATDNSHYERHTGSSKHMMKLKEITTVLRCEACDYNTTTKALLFQHFKTKKCIARQKK